MILNLKVKVPVRSSRFCQFSLLSLSQHFSITGKEKAEILRMSHNLYTLVNREIVVDQESFIHMRRATTNFRDNVHRREREMTDSDKVQQYSGSKGEGLRFQSSDEDWLIIYRKIKVIPSDCFITIYDKNTSLLMMENALTKPGYTLLRIARESEPLVTSASEYILNGRYLSSQLWKDQHLQSMLQTDTEYYIHGPCISSSETDYAYCFKSDIWPYNARDCIKRLLSCKWPSVDTVRDIVNNGVLFVAIGAKQSQYENIEWRISFNYAERKLVYAMTHTQLLCYGLLKLLLKEAIEVYPDTKEVDLDMEGLLCSYFLKTALFWEITTSKIEWNSSTFLVCFWNCFRRILQWVQCSFCPNFFIPENNMFEERVERKGWIKLLERLRRLYWEGYRCLMRCPSLEMMKVVFVRPDTKIDPVDQSRSRLALDIIKECENTFGRYKTFDTERRTACLLLYQLASSSNNSHVKFLAKNWFRQFMTIYVMTEFDQNVVQTSGNKERYKGLAERMKLLERCRTDSVSHFLYQAMLLYNAGECSPALKLVQHAKEVIATLGSMYLQSMTLEQCIAAGLENTTIESWMRKHYLAHICIHGDNYIPELSIESHVSSETTNPSHLQVPPLVCALFLEYLCQKKLGKERDADKASRELSGLLQHGNEHVPFAFGAISWQILGICQQMSGNYQAAR